MSKGSTRRPEAVPGSYAANYDRIFGCDVPPVLADELTDGSALRWRCTQCGAEEVCGCDARLEVIPEDES